MFQSVLKELKAGDDQPKPGIKIILGLDYSYRPKWQDNKPYLQVIYDI